MTTADSMLTSPNDIEHQTFASSLAEALNSEDDFCKVDHHGGEDSTNVTLSLEEAAADAMLSHHRASHTDCCYPDTNAAPRLDMSDHTHEDTRLPSHDTNLDATPSPHEDYAIVPANEFSGDVYPYDEQTPEGSPDGSATDDTSNDKASAINHVKALVPAQRKRVTTKEEHGGAFQPSRMGERGGLKIYGRSHVFIANFDARWASHLSWQTSPPTEFLNYLCAFIESKSRDLGGVDRLRSTRSKERFFQVRRFGYIERGESGQFNFVRFKCIAVHQGGGNWMIHDDAWRALLAFDLRNGDFAFAAQTARALAPKTSSESGSAPKRRKTIAGAIADSAGPAYVIPAEAAASHSPQIPDGRTDDHSPTSLALVPVTAHASTAPPSQTQKEGNASHQHSQSPASGYPMALNQGYPPHRGMGLPHLAPANNGGAHPPQYGYGMHPQQHMPWGYYPYPGGPPHPSHMPQMYYPPASFDGRTMPPSPMYPFPPPQSTHRGSEGGHTQSENGHQGGLPSEFGGPPRPPPLPVSPPLNGAQATTPSADATLPGQVRTAVDIMNSLFAGQQDYPSPNFAAAAASFVGTADDNQKQKKEMTFAEIASGLEESPPVSATQSQSGSAPPPPRTAGAAFASFPSRLSSCSVVSLCAFLDQAHQLIREGLALLKKTGWLSTPESLTIMRELAKFDKGHYSRLAVLAGEVSDYKSSSAKLEETISSNEGSGAKKRKRSALKEKDDLLARLGGAFASFLPSPEAELWRETHVEEGK